MYLSQIPFSKGFCPDILNPRKGIETIRLSLASSRVILDSEAANPRKGMEIAEYLLIDFCCSVCNTEKALIFGRGKTITLDYGKRGHGAGYKERLDTALE